MKKVLRIVIAAGVLAALPGSASAQMVKHEAELGSRIPNKSYVKPLKGPRAIAAGLAQCAVEKHPNRVDWFLRNSDALSSAPLQHGRNLAEYLGLDTCMNLIAEANEAEAATGKFNTAALRGLLSEQAYLANHPAYAAIASDTPIASRTFVSTGADLDAARANALFEDCIAEKNPEGADALLRTPPGATEEIAAARALAPTLNECLMKGQTLSLTISNVRAFAAQGMWQRFNASMPSSYAGQP